MDETEKEVKKLKSKLRGMEILMQQNAELERQIEHLCHELDEATLGVQKKGYLYKWRDRVISYASRWGLRYFVLQGNKLSYYADDHEIRPRRTIDLSQCFVREEPPKKNGIYHVFGIYMGDSEEGSLILRLSTESKPEAMLWIDMLEQACVIGDMSKQINSDQQKLQEEPVDTNHDFNSTRVETSTLNDVDDDEDKDEWKNYSIDQDDNPNPQMETGKSDQLLPRNIPSSVLKRVVSSSLVLKKAISRQTLARQQLSKRAPNEFTSSGTRLHHLEIDKNNQLKLDKPKSDSMKKFPGYKPMHIECHVSPLSSEKRPGDNNFRGFFNLGVIIFILSHLDLVVNNMDKYGFQLNAPREFELGYLTIGKAVISWLGSILGSFAIEWLAAKYRINEAFVVTANIILSSINIIGPCYCVIYSDTHPLFNMIYLFQSVIIWMKLISYAHANHDLRCATRRHKQYDMNSNGIPSSPSSFSRVRSHSNQSNGGIPLSPSKQYFDNNAKPFGSSGYSASTDQLQSIVSEVRDIQLPFLYYPMNITINNLMYFCIAPTLCYQLNYPRSRSVRYQNILFILIRMVFVGIVIVFSVEQYIRPTLMSSVHAMKDTNVLGIIERLLKLSIPNTYVWLLGFYFYFHLWLNLLAEITRFGDRQFYKEWWNSRTIDTYWRLWNLPVHHWVIRHLYYPLIRLKVPKYLATLFVFAFSAVMHELIISLPFRYLALHAFFGMLAQAPLIFVTKEIDKRFDNAFVGNAIFWCLFCVVGQPMGLIMYNYDLWKINT